MTMNVPRIEVGMASRMLTVVDQEPRNSQQTKPVNSAASRRVKRISRIDRSTKTVVSQLTSSFSPSGSWGARRAKRSLTARPTCTALAPRSLVMPKPTEVSPMVRLSRRRSSRPSSTTATSLRRTGEPWVKLTTRSRNESMSIASPWARTFISRSPLSMRPAGTSWCSRAIARLTSITVRPCASSRAASYQTRTLRSRKPKTKISPTPSIICSCGRTTLRT